MHTFLILSSADHSPWIVYTAGNSGEQAATGSASNTNNTNGQSAAATGNSRSAHNDGDQGQQRLWRQRAAAAGTILLDITNTIFKF